ncbi:sugar ABC transporter ATP-binding protein [Devosia psychrophila]|uniref:sugar ABC transporter ATP-binding protein n=1 Tax=Devosia psychrophila TaxID=728005 RepID=UPI00069A7A96|nr:sugar ABC transporter ATP-binding protein [Devosia psychrophila]
MTERGQALPPLLELRQVSKQFFGVTVLKQMSLTVHAGEVVGMVGENGSGKSTTMNLISGILRADGGEMLVDGAAYAPLNAKDAVEAGIGLIHQELNLFANLSIAENLAIRQFPKRWPGLPFIDGAKMRRDATAILAEVGLELDPRTPVNLLPPGERQLVEISKALAQRPRLLIFDEPTTSLTSREAERLFALVDRLRRDGIGMIYVSHILEDVLRLCDKVAVLRDGALVDNAPNAEMDVQRLVRGMLGRPVEELFPARTAPLARHVEALSVNGLTRSGQIRDVGFTVGTGEVVGIAGLMGSGRSETARCLFGLDPVSAGTVNVAGKPVSPLTPANCMSAGMAFLTEDRRGDGLLMSQSIEQNAELAMLADLEGGMLASVPRHKLAAAAAAMAQSMHIRARNFDRQPVQSLSGGNQQKVVLTKWLMRAPRVLLLDEPTRGIDIGARS